MPDKILGEGPETRRCTATAPHIGENLVTQIPWKLRAKSLPTAVGRIRPSKEINRDLSG